MELKDMILQTLTEIENVPNEKEINSSETKIIPKSESEFLYALREKTLVLFEGLQSPQIKDLPTKLDLVINYLQYQLSIIDEKLGH
ncbi:hypothetical protein BKH41_04790 [Helicobacter sp. 12S02232-10]|uniref:CiaD-like domain-containing protein n=1 Tax=Helicobacter sp. 12S02232-10 TaxID=1476197 RepID=UPI000BA69736|nr:hypothetical protein [Helicobacter sp. 12S02232-10]PAF48947.1 hypothetical protein BKH41_04790 [Helicobacter sp. 12S02232-10]